jgi:hypothetical protein
MKTTEFIVEYAGIGEDAETMSQDHEVQLARQQCYNAARDAIALHHILKDTPEQENLEDWIVEKLTQAASNLKDVIEHLEELRSGNEGSMEIMHAFSMESAEAKYAEMLGEARLDELNPQRYAEYDWQQQENPRQGQAQLAAPVFVIIDRATGKPYPQKFKVRSEAERAAIKMGGFSKVKVTSESEEVENDADPITELDSSTMQAYLQKRKETPTPRTMHKAGVQAKGVRSAHEKIHDKLVMKHAIAGGDTRVREATVDEAFKEVPTHGKTGKPNPNHPNFAKHDAAYKAQQAAMRPPRAPAQPKLTLNDVWRQVEHVVGQIFPDGDPIDWMAPWLEKRGYHDWDIGKIIDRAARANGYKDMYAYYDELKQQHADDAAYDDQMGEAVGDSDAVVFSGVGAFMRGKAPRIFKMANLTVVDQNYSEDEDIQEYTVTGSQDKIGAARTALERSPHFGGVYRASDQQGIGEAGAPRVKNPQMFRIDVPQGIRQPAAQAIKKLGMEIDGQGYTEGSTSWSFAVYNRKFASAEQCTEAMRKAMGGYNEYMRVADFVYQESKEQVDELSSATLKAYVPKANRSREKATDDMMNKGGYDPKVDDKMGRRAEYTMKAQNKMAQPVKEDATGGSTSVGGIAAGVAGARAGKPGTGKPKDLGNKVSRKQVQVGKGVY